MIVTILSIILFVIFITLSGFHFYWLAGGTWGVEYCIPTKSTTSKLPPIPKFATLIVALGLLSIGLLYIINLDLMEIQIPAVILKYGLWIVPCLFLLRSIGDFNYFGFFKKIKNTKFAGADSKIFSPLCLSIAIAGLLIQII